MAVDRSLTTLLRALQSVPDEEDTSRYYINRLYSKPELKISEF